MGAGRKTETVVLDTKNQNSRLRPANLAACARHLRKAELGGVIFGCKNATMKECLTKQLFGLPASHFSYVKNIDPGLPLFLFNYSTRKLHGVYEAASSGRMCIDPYCWSEDGKEKSPFPAQVCIHVRTQCRPLTEDQFRETISDNFYTLTHFWFELDHAQVEKLLILFASGPVSAIIPQTSFPRSTQWNVVPINKSQPCVSLNASFSSRANGENNSEKFTWNDIVDPDDTHSAKSSSDVPDDVWGPSLTDSNIAEIERSHSNLKGSCTNIGEEWETEKRESCSDKDTPGEREALVLQKLKQIVACHDFLSFPSKDMLGSDVVADTNGDVRLDVDVYEVDQTISPLQSESPAVPYFQADNQMPIFPSKDMQIEVTYATDNVRLLYSDVYEVGQPVSLLQSESPAVPDFQAGNQVPKFPSKGMQGSDAVVTTTEGVRLLDSDAVEVDRQVSPLHSESPAMPDFPNDKQDMETFRIMFKEQFQRTELLEKRLAQTETEIQQLKTRVYELELEVDGQRKKADKSIHKFYHEPSEKLVYFLGGSDGRSFLSSVDLYLPSADIIKSLKPMSCVRSYAAAAALNGNLYVFGGGNGASWYDSVECYRPESNAWTTCPSLMQKKSSLAGAAAQNRLYAIGGGNGVEILADVEMFDPILGRWIRVQSLYEKRFAPAAAELNGVLYAVGGFDGKKYLQSTERFDPREPSWTRLQNMKVRRGCHSLAVLNDKLFALGGYDGTQMLSTVESFDPRTCSWTMGDSMNFPRGYGGAAVLHDGLYAFAGLLDVNGTHVDKVECYKEGQGWKATNLKAFGQRSCFAMAVF